MNHDEYKADDVAISALVRAIAPPGASAATYGVLLAATRAAVDMTSVRSDGQVHHGDVLAILRCALGGIPKLRADVIRTVVREAIDHSRHLPHGQAELAIADRVATQLTGRSLAQ